MPVTPASRLTRALQLASLPRGIVRSGEGRLSVQRSDLAICDLLSSARSCNLAKVGVGGSNPLARSKFPRGNQWPRTVLRGRFLLPRPRRESRGSSRKRKIAGFGLPSALVASRNHGFPLQDRPRWESPRSTVKARFGRLRASPDAEARPILRPRALPRRGS
jgi:hypothetical protein